MGNSRLSVIKSKLPAIMPLMYGHGSARQIGRIPAGDRGFDRLSAPAIRRGDCDDGTNESEDEFGIYILHKGKPDDELRYRMQNPVNALHCYRIRITLNRHEVYNLRNRGFSKKIKEQRGKVMR